MPRRSSGPVLTSVFPPAPSHGVSGFKVLGKAGDFNFQFHDNGDPYTYDSAASRFSMQQHQALSTPNNFTPFQNTPSTFALPNYDAAALEENYVEEIDNEAKTASKELSRVLQRKRKGLHGSYLQDRLYEGFGQMDPEIQRYLVDQHHGEEIVAATRPATSRHTPFNPTPPIRGGAIEHHGSTQNKTYDINLSMPNVGVWQADGAAKDTPPMVNESHTAPGTNPTAAAAGITGLFNRTSDGRPAGSSGWAYATNATNVPGTIQERADLPYLLQPPPPEPDVRAYQGLLRDTSPALSYIAPNHRPVQHSL